MFRSASSLTCLRTYVRSRAKPRTWRLGRRPLFRVPGTRARCRRRYTRRRVARGRSRPCVTPFGECADDVRTHASADKKAGGLGTRHVQPSALRPPHGVAGGGVVRCPGGTRRESGRHSVGRASRVRRAEGSLRRDCTAIGIVVDVARLPVYLVMQGKAVATAWPLIPTATAGVLAGTMAGQRSEDVIGYGTRQA